MLQCPETGMICSRPECVKQTGQSFSGEMNCILEKQRVDKEGKKPDTGPAVSATGA